MSLFSIYIYREIYNKNLDPGTFEEALKTSSASTFTVLCLGYFSMEGSCSSRVFMAWVLDTFGSLCFKVQTEDGTWMSQEVSKRLVNGLWVITPIYTIYREVIIHLLQLVTSWDILVLCFEVYTSQAVLISNQQILFHWLLGDHVSGSMIW